MNKFTLHLYHTLVWNLLGCASFALNMASLHDSQKLAGKSADIVAGVNVKACSTFHRESSTAIGCL